MKNEKKKRGDFLDIKLMSRVYSLAAPYKKQVWLSVLLTIIMAVLGASRPMLVQYTLDEEMMSGNNQGLLNMTLMLIGMLVLQTLSQFYQTYLTSWLGQSAIRDLRNKVFKHITSLNLNYFDKTPVGTLITRCISDIETIAEIFAEGLISISGDVLQIFLILFFMFYIDWRLALISLSVLPLLLLSAYVFKELVKKSFLEVRNAVARLNTFVQEHIQGMQVVQIFGIEKQEFKKFEEINAHHTSANVRGVMYYSIFFPVVEIITAASIALVVWYGLGGILRNEGITFGMITSFIMYVNMFYRPIRVVADRFNTMQMGMVASERIFKLTDDLQQIEKNNGTKVPSIKGEVEFQNVWFAYQNEEYVLKNISFKVEAGKTLALVGTTGSGKTSIINLINRSYLHQKGCVLVDGLDVNEIDLQHLRSNIGLVLQDVFLFSGSIRDNITLNNEEISDEQVIAAARAVGAHSFISKLPGGYNFKVKERGASLSTGQRQLISFARVLAYNPKILILDEATSSIDSESEELIQHAVEVLLKGRTSIVIAHRLSTIVHAHEILVMENGTILERGNHAELLVANGVYKNLFEKQFEFTS